MEITIQINGQAVKICRSLNDNGIPCSLKRVQRHMKAQLLRSKAVKNACLNVKNTEDIILHSDLGSQYTSQLFESYLSNAKMLHSFSRKGNPYDNACIESFHSVLKKEEIYLHTYQNSGESRRAIFEYIESWYNRKRIHSAIDYMTPQQKEGMELKKVA